MDAEVKGSERQDLGIPDFCRAMVDHSPMPMACLVGTGHTFGYVNPAFCVLVGHQQRELLGQLFSQAVLAGDECLSLLDRVYRTGHAEAHAGQENLASHRFYWSYVMWPFLAANGQRAGIMIQVTETTPFVSRATAMNEALMIGSVRQHELTDIAETLNVQLQAEIVQRKHAEEEMESQQHEITASERQYRGLIEAIPQIVWTATPLGMMEFANAKWFQSFGVDLETFNHSGWSAMLHPDDMLRSLEAWADGLESHSAFQVEHRLRNLSNASFRWYLSRAVPIVTEDGSVIRWFGTSTDVDDQKRAELALFTKQKLESLGLLAGGVAHDFNNLLCVILGGASLAAEALPKTHPAQENLTDIIHASDRAAHLTRQMLAYAGKGRFLVEQIDMSDLARSTGDLIKASIPKSVSLIMETRQELPPVDADSGQMQQVVMNLILNAAESIDESIGGSVVVKTELVRLVAAEIGNIRLVTGSLAPGLYVVVEIRDTGSGMNQATKEKIFDPFFTTKFTGRGLGLSAVEGILRTQKGALELTSVVGKGSTFRVYLVPSLKPKYDNGTPRDLPKVAGAGTILVVDDEEMIRRLAKFSLENSGFAVRVANGGQEAIDILLKKSEGPISLILLDLSMPGMSGRQFLDQIRIIGIKLPVLICSGYSEVEVYREFSGLDIAGFVQKPFTPRQLGNRVSSVLRPEHS